MSYYRIGLLVLLLSEYGLRSRRTTQAGWEGLWRPGRTLLRLALWVAIGLWLSWPPRPGVLPLLLGLFLLGELGALLLLLGGPCRRVGAHYAIGPEEEERVLAGEHARVLADAEASEDAFLDAAAAAERDPSAEVDYDPASPDGW